MNNKEFSEYKKSRAEQILEIRKESELLFDKQIRYISAGAIALSVTLISSISDIKLNWLLLVGWILLIATLLFNLLSYKTSSRSVDYDIIHKPEKSSDNVYTFITCLLNWLSIVTLVAGLLFLVIFFYKIK